MSSQVSQTDYIRVTYRPEGAKRSKQVILYDAKIGRIMGVPHLSGAAVNKAGTRVGKTHIITESLVRKMVPLSMNRHYCLLEPV